MQEVRTFIPQDFARIQKWLGERPGDYVVDPFYIKRGYGGKVQFWNVDRKKWEFVRIGDKFIKSQDGVIRVENMKGARA